MGWIIGAILASGLVAIVALQSPLATLLIVVTAVMTGLIYAARKRLAPLVFSPVAFVTIGLFVMGVLGAALYAGVSRAEAGGGARVELSEADTAATFVLMTVAAASVLAGGLITANALPRIASTTTSKFKVELPQAAYAWLLLGSLVPLGILAAARGTDVFARQYYIAEAVQDGGLAGLAGQMAIAATIAVGYLIMATKGGTRLFAVLILLGYIGIFFGAGSRRMAMIPILVMVGVFLARRTKMTGLLLAASAALSLYLIRLPLYLRALPEHGIIPYIQHFPGFFDYGVGWDSIGRNVLISFGIIGATAYQQPSISNEIFWASINPATGAAAGWYEYADRMRINIYTPYAGVGELGNHGMAYVVIYFFVAGIILALGDRAVMRFMERGHGVLSLALVGLAGLFYLYSIQYNLRSSTRMLFYGIVAGVVLEWISSALARKRDTAMRPPSRAYRKMRRDSERPPLSPLRSR